MKDRAEQDAFDAWLVAYVPRDRRGSAARALGRAAGPAVGRLLGDAWWDGFKWGRSWAWRPT